MAIEAGQTGKCPHCGVTNRFETTESVVLTAGMPFTRDVKGLAIEDARADVRRELNIARCTNPGCRRVILTLDDQMIFPLGTQRPQAPTEVPPSIASDYHEACLVEALSPKAAAALARRGLQNLLNDKGIKGTKNHDLDDQITEAITSLPSDLGDNIDAIRVVGNFAAHPNKSKNTGDIVDVESGEAEYTLDILFDLFDFYYVRPARSQAKKAAIQAKIKAAGSGAQIK